MHDTDIFCIRICTPVIPPQVKREYELEWKRLEIMERIAADGRKVRTRSNMEQVTRVPTADF